MAKVLLSIPDKFLNQIDEVANNEQRTRSELIREALRNYMKRNVMFDLKKAGFLEGKPGPGGTKLIKDLENVTLFDVYISVLDPKESMLKFYEAAENNLSKVIRTVVDTQFNNYRDLLLSEMKNTTVKTICCRIQTEL